MRLGLMLLLGFGTVVAAPQKQTFSDKQLAQQQRMTDCSADAKQKALKSDARMAFMKTCLAGGQVTVELDGITVTAPVELREASGNCDREPDDTALEDDCAAQ